MDNTKKLAEAMKLFETASMNSKENQSNIGIKPTLKESLSVFEGANLFGASSDLDIKEEKQVKKTPKDYRREINVKRTNLERNIKEILLSGFALLTNLIMPSLVCSFFCRKNILEFMSKYLELLSQEVKPRVRISGDSEDNEKEVLENLKGSLEGMESKIRAKYKEYLNSINETTEPEFKIEAESTERSMEAEIESIILQYKSLFYEYIARIERAIEDDNDDLF